MLSVLKDSGKKQIPYILTCSTDIMVIVTRQMGSPGHVGERKTSSHPTRNSGAKKRKSQYHRHEVLVT